MNFELNDEHKLIQNTAKEFAINELLPGVIDRDKNKLWPKNAVKKMAELGFMGIMTSKEFNGGGLDTLSRDYDFRI